MFQHLWDACDLVGLTGEPESEVWVEKCNTMSECKVEPSYMLISAHQFAICYTGLFLLYFLQS
jgi:hypothetical protein